MNDETLETIEMLVKESFNTQEQDNRNTDYEDLPSPLRKRFVEAETCDWLAEKEKHSSFQWPTIGQFTDQRVGINAITEYIEKVISLDITCSEEQPYPLFIDNLIVFVSTSEVQHLSIALVID